MESPGRLVKHGNMPNLFNILNTLSLNTIIAKCGNFPELENPYTPIKEPVSTIPSKLM